jgi:hypothetical protein
MQSDTVATKLVWFLSTQMCLVQLKFQILYFILINLNGHVWLVVTILNNVCRTLMLNLSYTGRISVSVTPVFPYIPTPRVIPSPFQANSPWEAIYE